MVIDFKYCLSRIRNPRRSFLNFLCFFLSFVVIYRYPIKMTSVTSVLTLLVFFYSADVLFIEFMRILALIIRGVYVYEMEYHEEVSEEEIERMIDNEYAMTYNASIMRGLKEGQRVYLLCTGFWAMRPFMVLPHRNFTIGPDLKRIGA